jgi:hypothetical protein
MGFWTGGPGACRAGLKEEHRATVAKLEERLQEAGKEEERRQIEDELRQVEETYKERLRRVSENLF